MATILIVAPASPERDALVGALTAQGHGVTVSPDGEDGLALWRLARHELAILDDKSPRRSGLELAARIKAETKDGFAPVILLHERADADGRVAALAVVDDVLTRPLTGSEVVARVEALLRTRRLVDGLRVARAESEARTLDDPLTGLRNRLFLHERLSEEWKRSARYNEPLSLLVIGVEGQAARATELADRLLVAVAGVVVASLRQIDLVTRHGAADLAALLPNTHFSGSLVCAERIHRAVRLANVDGVVPVVSMGIAFFPGKDLAEPNDLLRIAGRALERAREDGAGNVCLYQHQGYLFKPQ